jgi:hypothetical protein
LPAVVVAGFESERAQTNGVPRVEEKPEPLPNRSDRYTGITLSTALTTL